MNIFVVNGDPVKAAQELCDAHVVKMPTECVQLLSTAYEHQRYKLISATVRQRQGCDPTCQSRTLLECDAQLEALRSYPELPFKPVSRPEHRQHPIVIWVQADPVNLHWLMAHAHALFDEYTLRFGRVHGSLAPFKLAQDIMRTSFRWSFAGKRQALLPGRQDIYRSMKFCQAMPEELRSRYRTLRGTVEAYRRFYVRDKVVFARWANGRPPPSWWPFSTWKPPHGNLAACRTYPDAVSASINL